MACLIAFPAPPCPTITHNTTNTQTGMPEAAGRDENGAAKSQLTSARSQIAHVQELLLGVEQHITASKSKSRRSYRRTSDVHVLANKPKHVLRTQAGFAGRRYSTLDEHDPRPFDVKVLKTKNDGIELMDKWHNSKHCGAKRSGSEIRPSTSMADKAESPWSSGLIQNTCSLRRSKSDETSNASPMPMHYNSELSAQTKKVPNGVLKSSKSLPQQHEKTCTKRVSFIRAPIDPEADHDIPQQGTDPEDGAVVIEFPSEAFPIPNDGDHDDQSVLSLFRTTEEIRTKEMSSTVMATVERRNEQRSTKSKTNNRQKTFKKSLDRPISRRNSTAGLAKSTQPSYSRRNSDMAYDDKKHAESYPPTSSVSSMHGKINHLKQNFMKYVAQNNNGRSRFD